MTPTAGPPSWIDANNRETLRAIADGAADAATYTYFGYVAADIFDCPPFAIFTNNDCPRAAQILYQRRFEPASMALWCRYARSASAILDIGAHIGVYALAAAALRSDIPIHAFEPNPYAYARLRVNKAVNGFANIVEHPFALGHAEAEDMLITWLTKSGAISSGTRVGKYTGPGNEYESRRVPMKTLDSLGLGDLGRQPLIKIDVEGAEYYVISGMTAALQSKPDIILETFDQRSCDAINQALLPMGYKAYAIDEVTGAVTLRDALVPAAWGGENFNQFLTTRPLISS